jgi:hypothetical protein
MLHCSIWLKKLVEEPTLQLAGGISQSALSLVLAEMAVPAQILSISSQEVGLCNMFHSLHTSLSTAGTTGVQTDLALISNQTSVHLTPKNPHKNISNRKPT